MTSLPPRNPLLAALFSTIGLKIIVALSGLALVAFLFVHMAGNWTTLTFLGGGQDALNNYAHKLQTLPWPILWGFRLGLLGVLVVHIWATVTLVHRNRAAKGSAYVVNKSNKASVASRTMIITGLVVLTFVVFHIWHLTVRGAPFEHYNEMNAPLMIGGHEHTVPDVFGRVVEAFRNPAIALFYILGVGLLCLHISHGIQSAFRTLGLTNGILIPWMNLASHGIAVFIFVGMSIVPASILLGIVK